MYERAPFGLKYLGRVGTGMLLGCQLGGRLTWHSMELLLTKLFWPSTILFTDPGYRYFV